MKHSLPMAPSTEHRQTLAFLLPDLRGGGAERVMLTLAKEFARLGYAPSFLVAKFGGALQPEVAQLGFPVVDLKAERLRSVVAPLRAWLRAETPAALIPAMWPLTSLAIWAARGSNVPVITTDHATLSDQYAHKGAAHRIALRASIRATYPFARANVSVSAGAALDLEKLGFLARGSVEVIHNPIETPLKSSAKAQWPADARHRILAVGNLRWQKDFPTLLSAFRLLLDRGIDAELVILGEGPERGALEALSGKLDLSGRLTLAGYTPEPGAYYASAHVFALSSQSEGFANVLVEAMAHGLPIVSTDCPNGPAEIVSCDALGALVPVKNAPAMADALFAALNTPHDQNASRTRARDFRPRAATSKFSALLPATQAINLERDR